MPFQIVRDFEFSAAHYLTKYHGKCEQLHGHNYRLRVTVIGPLNSDDVVVDFVELKGLVKDTVISQLDHTNLNDRFPNPTCEVVAQWIFRTLRPQLAITQVQLWETSSTAVIYTE